MEWEKVEVLGKGSFGLVLRAVNNKDPTLPNVAIKSSRILDSGSLRKEKRILQDLEGLSPYILKFIADSRSFNPQRGFLYNLHLEYAPGGTLSDLIRKRGVCLQEHEVKYYTRMILKGLCCIHQKGYVHCDLKPANILVFPLTDGTNCLKIADFGVSKEPGEELLRGKSTRFKIRGTPLYMSPESFLFGEIEMSFDIWSLGCIVVEMLTGNPARQWVDGDRKLESQLALVIQRPNIPQSMSDTGKDFLRKCFTRNPTKRWTAEMLLNHPYIGSEHAAEKVGSKVRGRGLFGFLPRNLMRKS